MSIVGIAFIAFLSWFFTVAFGWSWVIAILVALAIGAFFSILASLIYVLNAR